MADWEAISALAFAAVVGVAFYVVGYFNGRESMEED